MKQFCILITALLAILTAGCVLSGKAKQPQPAPAPVTKPAPPAPPPPQPQALSIPQTQVELPRPQPVDPAALSSNTPPPVAPAEPPPPVRPPAGRRSTPAAVQPAPAQAPPVAPADPPQIQEIVPAAEAKRLQEQAQARRRDVQQILDQLARRRLTAAQRNVITVINALLVSSADAEKRGDMKLADALAERAQILARDLANGK